MGYKTINYHINQSNTILIGRTSTTKSRLVVEQDALLTHQCHLSVKVTFDMPITTAMCTNYIETFSTIHYEVTIKMDVLYITTAIKGGCFFKDDDVTNKVIQLATHLYY